MDVKPQTNLQTAQAPGQASAMPDRTKAHRQPADRAGDEPKPDSLLGFVWFLIKLVLAVLILRSFVIAPFSIPTQSMLPQLDAGDYLIASKWPYGYSRHSLPFNAPLISGRILAQAPRRGDIVIFKHPVDQQDYVKRVIALPGDTVTLVDGQIVLNGVIAPQTQLTDLASPISLDQSCPSGRWETPGAAGETLCLTGRKRETLPEARSYVILDEGRTPQDAFAPVVVPEGRVFVLGDNRDRSLDSRFPAQAGLGVGLVPQANLVGRAEFIFWSTDGSAELLRPWTWFSSARWDRIGTQL